MGIEVDRGDVGELERLSGSAVVVASRNRDSGTGLLRTWLRRKLQVWPGTGFGDEELAGPVRQQPYAALVVMVARVERAISGPESQTNVFTRYAGRIPAIEKAQAVDLNS